ncbi:MAG TPA: hypothetical protein VGN52_09545 [Burkholderiales bacterium]|jgi:hypothetical protein
MIWKVLLVGWALHVVGAGVILRSQARRVCNWRIPLALAIGGQLATSLAGLAAGLGCVLIFDSMGMPASYGLYALGAFAAAIAWGLALKALVARMAQHAKGAFYSSATMRRISTRSFFCVLACYAGALVLALGAWHIMHLPAIAISALELTAPMA